MRNNNDYLIIAEVKCNEDINKFLFTNSKINSKKTKLTKMFDEEKLNMLMNNKEKETTRVGL